MSHSYKRNPITKDKDRYMQKLASRKVRRHAELFQGNSYKRIFENWDISDFKSYSLDAKRK